MNNKMGFMLIEMLVALVVFCALAGIATSYIAYACAHIKHAHHLLNAVQRARETLSHITTTARKEKDSLVCVTSPCPYTQKISSAQYKPLDESLFCLEHLAIVDAGQEKSIIFSTLVSRMTSI